MFLLAGAFLALVFNVFTVARSVSSTIFSLVFPESSALLGSVVLFALLSSTDTLSSVLFGSSVVSSLLLSTTNQRSKMPDMDITEEKVKKILTNLKNGKATGPDGLKGELYKAMADSEICLETLTKCYEKELNIKEKPEKWKTSKTKLLKKKNKPSVKDLRPLALTDISYKIFMSLIKQEIEDHLITIKEDNEVQAGFKKGGRIRTC